MEETNAPEKAAAAADKIVKGVNDIFERANLPFFLYNIMSTIHDETTSFLALRLSDPDFLGQLDLRRACAQEYRAALANNGVIGLQASRMYVSMAHDAEAIDRTIKAWENIVKMLKN